MAEPKKVTPEEFAEAGVEFTEPVIIEREPPRAAFTEHALRGEPETDIKIKVGQVAMRERIVIVDTFAEGVLGADETAPNMMVVGISNALLDDNDSIATMPDGKHKIATLYTVTFSAEALGRIGSAEALREVLKIEREKAAHKANLEFQGMAIADGLVRKKG